MATAEEQEYYDDPKYRAFASQIEKVLKNFEYSTEWADLISALVKLNRVLQANANFTCLPKRITIGKRLSQCLHPALPGGVHIKALDVYDTIFKIIGPKRLQMDLCIYGTGIFSLLANASMQVRPVLLNVYETHLLPLGQNLRTSLDGMLLGLLPGLEEGSEHFDRINLLLDKIAKTVGLQFFYSSIWRCVLSSPSSSIVRLSAMQLVLRQFDKRKMTDDQLHLIGLDVDMMVQAVCQALQDDTVLTQRATLDVLTICFPLSSLPVSRSDAQAIISSGIYILLRRDMSLNRRLYSWMLGIDLNKGLSKSGSSGGNNTVSKYFEQNTRKILTDAIFTIVRKLIKFFESCCCGVALQAASGTEVKFIRVLISLLDKAEVGPVIINDILSCVLRLVEKIDNVYRSTISSQTLNCNKCSPVLKAKENCSRAHSEFIKSVNLFISSFETDFIWSFLADKFVMVCSETSAGGGQKGDLFTYPDLCGIIDTLLHIISMETYVEIQTVCLPELLNLIFCQLSKNCQELGTEQLASCLKLCLEVMKHIQPFQPGDLTNQNNSQYKMETCARSFKEFLVAFIKSKILKHEDSVEAFMAVLKKKPCDIVYPTGYEVVLKSRATEKADHEVELSFYEEKNEMMLQVFKDALKILVDICCFPVLSGRKSGANDARLEELSDSSEPPEWLLCLMTCAGRSQRVNSSSGEFDEEQYFSSVSITACGTVLELMALTLSSSDGNSNPDPEATGNHSVVSVVVPPPLQLSHLKWIHEKSNFYSRICRILWEKLESNDTSNNLINFHPTCARLLLLLHQLCPVETVERILLQDLLTPDQNSRVVAIEKFTKLWHYMRSEVPHSQVKGSKTFSRCLFAVLDQLTLQRYSPLSDVVNVLDTHGQAVVCTTVSTWLRHALEEGDICRLIEPYVLILLHSKTHRKSLQNVLQHENHVSDIGFLGDQYDKFLQKHREQLSVDCSDCYEVQKGLITTEAIELEKNSSVDSSALSNLCQVHQQMAKERYRYEHLVALLTLSDELNGEIAAHESRSEEDLQEWAVGFVESVIQQGLRMYQSEIAQSQEETLSTVSLPSHQIGLEAFENNYSSADSIISQGTEAIELNQSFLKARNPLYEHVLIYQEKFDANRVLYSLQGILNIVSANPSVFIHSACTMSLASSTAPYAQLLQELLVRHERSVHQGISFYDSTTAGHRITMKNKMLIEVLISVCLYYIRSSVQSTNDLQCDYSELNHDVQCLATNLLGNIIQELTNIAQRDDVQSNFLASKFSSTAGHMSAFIISVLQRQQVQSSVLTCLQTTIYALKDLELARHSSLISISQVDISSASDESDPDLDVDDKIVKGYLGTNILEIRTLFSHFVRLTFDLVKLEHFLFAQKQTKNKKVTEASLASSILLRNSSNKEKPKMKQSLKLLTHLLDVTHQYDSTLPVSDQTVFVSTILEIYRLDKNLALHQECSILLKTILPYFGAALSDVVIPILLHQCLNLENIIDQAPSSHVPPDYVETTVKTITTLIHYCLLNDTHGKRTELAIPESSPADNISINSSKLNPGSTGGSIGSGLSTLLNVFNSSSNTKSNAVNNDSEWSDGLVAARVAVLNNLARIVSCICLVWREVVNEDDHVLVASEKSKSVAYNILQLLGPLALQYGEYLLVAFALVWQNREQGVRGPQNGEVETLIRDDNKELKYVMDVILAIRLLSIEAFLSLVKQVLKSPPPVLSEATSPSLQESILQMLLSYMKRQKPAILSENWPGFMSVLQETLSLGTGQSTPNTPSTVNVVSPNCYFLLLHLLSEYVKRASPFTQKKEQKELQDIAGRCIESCNFIAGSSLEQSTWMRRNVSVLPGPQAPEGAIKTHKKTESQSSIDLVESQHLNGGIPSELPVQTSSSDTILTSMAEHPAAEVNRTNDDTKSEVGKERPTSLPRIPDSVLNPLQFRNSVKALTVLSQVVAHLLDVVYSSEEKDKVIPVLTSIMANVTPYLRNHSADNIPSFCASISFLSSISSFQHTRKAWRKDVIELFLDAPFFHMPQECASGWQTIVDNLMTHDKTTFKEVMSRMSLSRSGPSTPSLNIFSNKEQELELRALHIKRLAFIVFSSEVDQYQKHLPEIQERLAESLRFHNVPGVQCQVFLCLRVLLLRISPHSLTSLWPTIFTELVHVMLQLEQSLNPSVFDTDVKSKSKQKTSRNNSPTTPQAPKTVMTCWLNMYLSACKLLDLALCLPVHYVPQFQLYRWSFVGESTPPETPSDPSQFRANGVAEDTKENEEQDPAFVPHCVRIQRLFSDLVPNRANITLSVTPQKPLLNITRLKNVEQLQLFFNTITSPLYLLNSQTSSVMSKSSLRQSSSNEGSCSLPLVEKTLLRDFIRPML